MRIRIAAAVEIHCGGGLWSLSAFVLMFKVLYNL